MRLHMFIGQVQIQTRFFEGNFLIADEVVTTENRFGYDSKIDFGSELKNAHAEKPGPILNLSGKCAECAARAASGFVLL